MRGASRFRPITFLCHCSCLGCLAVDMSVPMELSPVALPLYRVVMSAVAVWRLNASSKAGRNGASVTMGGGIRRGQSLALYALSRWLRRETEALMQMGSGGLHRLVAEWSKKVPHHSACRIHEDNIARASLSCYVSFDDKYDGPMTSSGMRLMRCRICKGSRCSVRS